MSAGSNWAGSHTYTAPTFVEPTSIDELQQIVASTDRVRALGSRHSFNDLADTPGTLIGTARLPHSLEVIDEDTIAVAPWMKYGEIATLLKPHGLALHNLASLPTSLSPVPSRPERTDPATATATWPARSRA